ncbi:GTP-binding protein [uncultured Methanomethylovorans sp.]|uniref:CobW family GTP-binding protein n=1 Tax=uncultured Methanomethylovorans sp. TaxID=183759 RepID=UPI002AA6321D|nr:GTP-binding protein [uncultured Methanomethylovorans sp.]
MKVMIIGGFLGSGKTTTLLSLGRHMVEIGHKVAIIVNEIGEVGVDGETLSGSGLIAKELTSGCICCTLKISMEYTLQTLEEEYDPDVLIVEPTGIALPLQIKEHVALMGLSDLSFAPVVTIVDASRFTMELSQVPKFIVTQIEEAEILCVNKIDLVDRELLSDVTGRLMDLNPNALIVEFSARQADSQFMKFIDLLAGEGSARQAGESINSIELSQVSSYSGKYFIDDHGLDRVDMVSMVLKILEEVKKNIQLINPAFIGHVKISLSLGKNLVKGSLTSSLGQPLVELLESSGQDRELKFLSAVTHVSKPDLVNIIGSAIRGNLEKVHVKYKSSNKENNLICIASGKS